MASTWREIQEDERWEGLTYDQKIAVRDRFYDRELKPKAGTPERETELRNMFNERTNILDSGIPVHDPSTVPEGQGFEFKPPTDSRERFADYVGSQVTPAEPKPDRSYTQQYNDETVRQGKQRTNEDGSTTTVLSKTAQGPDGKWYNVPGFDRDTGIDYGSDDEAIEAALSDIQAGKVNPYSTADEAVRAAEEEHVELEQPDIAGIANSYDLNTPQAPAQREQPTAAPRGVEMRDTIPFDHNGQRYMVNTAGYDNEEAAIDAFLEGDNEPGSIEQFDDNGDRIKWPASQETTINPSTPDTQARSRFARRHGADNPALDGPNDYSVDRPFQGTVTQTPETFALMEKRHKGLKALVDRGLAPDTIYSHPDLGRISDEEFTRYATRVTQLNDLTKYITPQMAGNPMLAMFSDEQWADYLGKLEMRKRGVENEEAFQKEVLADFKNGKDWIFGRVQQYAGMGKEWAAGVTQMAADHPDNMNPALEQVAKDLYEAATTNMRHAGFSRPENIILRMGSDAMDSLPYLASGMFASAVSKLPWAGEAVMAAMVAPGEYVKARIDDGKDPVQATREMVFRTLAEVVPERIFGVFQRAAIGIKGLKGLGINTLAEGGSEAVTELAHIGGDIDETMNAPTFGEGFGRIGWAFGVGMMMGGPASVPGMIADTFRDRDVKNFSPNESGITGETDAKRMKKIRPSLEKQEDRQLIDEWADPTRSDNARQVAWDILKERGVNARKWLHDELLDTMDIAPDHVLEQLKRSPHEELAKEARRVIEQRAREKQGQDLEEGKTVNLTGDPATEQGSATTLEDVATQEDTDDGQQYSGLPDQEEGRQDPIPEGEQRPPGPGREPGQEQRRQVREGREQPRTRDQQQAEVDLVNEGGEKSPPVIGDGEENLNEAAHEAATSPTNDLPEPTEGQKDAGNYKKGHVNLHGFDITIENPSGSTREGKDWQVTMVDHYGYIKRTEGNDGDHVDVFLGPEAASDRPRVAIVDQRDIETGRFDEHKIIIGAEQFKEKETYFRNYSEGFEDTQVYAGHTMTTLPALKEWLENGNQSKPFGNFDFNLFEGAKMPPAPPKEDGITSEYRSSMAEFLGQPNDSPIPDSFLKAWSKEEAGAMDRAIPKKMASISTANFTSMQESRATQLWNRLEKDLGRSPTWTEYWLAVRKKLNQGKQKELKQAATREETYFKGDLAEFTGKIEEQHGGMFEEVELLEGHLKGEKRWKKARQSDEALWEESNVTRTIKLPNGTAIKMQLKDTRGGANKTVVRSADGREVTGHLQWRDRAENWGDSRLEEWAESVLPKPEAEPEPATEPVPEAETEAGTIKEQLESFDTAPDSAIAYRPQFFVEWGGPKEGDNPHRFKVKSVQDAIDKWNDFRQQTGAGSRDLGTAKITDENGNLYVKIMYNGTLRDRADQKITPELAQTQAEGYKTKDVIFPAHEEKHFAKKHIGDQLLTSQQAAAQLEAWKREAKRIGREEDHSREVILSLFDTTGAWSQPYVDAGYDVIRYDIKDGDDLVRFMPTGDILDIHEAGKKVVGILAACPCTSFAVSGARWWKTQHDLKSSAMVEKKYGLWATDYFDTPLEYATTLVDVTKVIIEFTDPTFYVLENPIGRIATEANLPKPLLVFQPHHYGDPYTKTTQLWGEFNPALPTANVEATLGSLMHKLRGDVEEDKARRSQTPEGFAYAFFMANSTARDVEPVEGYTGTMREGDNVSGEFTPKVTADTVTTRSGQTLTFPDVRGLLFNAENDSGFGVGQKAKNDRNKLDRWLIDAAVEEARIRGDNMNRVTMAGISLNNVTIAEREGMSLYLFNVVDVADLFKVPAPAEPDVSTTQRILNDSQFVQGVYSFRSGASRPGDLSGYQKAGKAVGVALPELQGSATSQVIEMAKDGHPVFIDSGAYSAFKQSLAAYDKATTKAEKDAATALAELPFDELLARYEAIVESVGTGSKETLWIVAPDVVGKQARTIELQKEHMSALMRLAKKTNLIMPVQKGDGGFFEAVKHLGALFGDGNYVLGLPSQAEAMSPQDIENLFRNWHGPTPKAVHLLGIAANRKKLLDLKKVIEEYWPGNEAPVITSDANRLRANSKRIGEAVPAIRDRITEEKMGTAEFDDTEQMGADDIGHGWTPKQLKEYAGYIGVPLAELKVAIKQGTVQEMWDRHDILEDSAVMAAWRALHREAEYQSRGEARAEAVAQTEQPTTTDQGELFGDIKEGLGAILNTEETENEKTAERLGSEGKGALEGAPADDVPGTQEVEGSGTGTTGRSEPDSEGDRRADGGRVQPPRSVDGSTEQLPDTATGERGRGTTDGRPEVDAGTTGSPAGNERVPGRTGDSTDRTTGANAGSNYVITPSDELGSGGAKTKYKDNIKAIELLKDLEQTERMATPEEQRTLARYVGWGGIPQAFRHPSKGITKGWESEVPELEAVLTESELEAAGRSTTNAHFTSTDVIEGIYAGIRRLGFRGGRILEPAVGTGNFFGLLPETMRAKSRLVGVELDSITGRIAQQLYPQATVHAEKGFQEIPFQDNTFDLVIGNPPFGNYPITDMANRDISGWSIHNYFFGKAIKKVRPGGLVAMVISRHLMDKKVAKTRKYLESEADFLGAIRLPNTAFKENALTEVVTDIIFLQKRIPGEPSKSLNWTNVAEIPDALGGEDIVTNEYFARYPEMMLGTWQRSGSMYREDEPTLAPNEKRTLPNQIKSAVEMLPVRIYKVDTKARKRLEKPIPDAELQVDTTAKVHGYFESKGNVYQRLPDVVDPDGNTTFRSEPATLRNKKARDRMISGIRVRDSLNNLLKAEINPNSPPAALKLLRAQLNKHYNAFQKAHGYFHDQQNKLALRDDPDFPRLLALETDYSKPVSATVAKNTGQQVAASKAGKADIFKKAVAIPQTPPNHADSASDGLLISLNETGRANLERIAELTGNTEEEVAEELLEGGELFRDPKDGYVIRSEYLSGNVKRKLAEARAESETDSNMMENIKALAEVQPADIPAIEISSDMHSPWIPPDTMNEYLKDLTGWNTSYAYIPALGRWEGSQKAWAQAKPAAREYATQAVSLQRIIDHAIRGKEVKVTFKNDDGSTSVDAVATQEANAKRKELQEHFQEWLWKTPERRSMLVRHYNDNFNTQAKKKFDGSFLTFPGMNNSITLDPHQANGAWRLISDGYGLIDHVVGAGKTFLAIAAIMEKKRMGLVNKPMIVVPNHLVTQWAEDVAFLYPNANVLAATKQDFQKDNRRKFFARIATGDWDAVIVAHSSFSRIDTSPEDKAKQTAKQIRDLEISQAAVEVAAGKSDKSYKELQKKKESLQAKLEAHQSMIKTDDFMDWRELGVDDLVVDEAHEFKNLFYTTQHTRIAGLGDTKGSQKASDLYLKTEITREINGSQRGVTFLTGTPVSNTVAELYTMFRYVAPNLLRERNMDMFDGWAALFADIVSEAELDSTAQGYKMKERFRSFKNLPELLGIYRTFADQMTNEQLMKAHAEAGKRWPIPKIKGGKPENVIVERSAEQAEFMAQIVHRAENLPTRPGKGDDNMLTITYHARLAALDMRLIDPSLPDNPDSKTNVAVRNIKKTYDKWNADKGTQLVFIDLSTPKGTQKKEQREYRELLVKADSPNQTISKPAQKKLDRYSPDDVAALTSQFSVYDDMRAKLAVQGIPDNEIAFIHDYNTDVRKQLLFEQVRSGKIRILLGSTFKMGAGMNVQERLVALHHLDAPWKPADITQREGRIIRRGNSFFAKDPDGFEIEIKRYATESTYDSRMWQVQETKARYIMQLYVENPGRVMEDIGGEAANAAEMKAAASGNPYMLEQVELSQKINQLSLGETAHTRRRFDDEEEIMRLEKDGGPQGRYEERVDRMKRLVAVREANPLPDKFSLQVGANNYTKVGKAATAIESVVKGYVANKKRDPGTMPVKLFSYRGFDVSMAHSMWGNLEMYMSIEGKTVENVKSYTHIDSFSGEGALTRIKNRVSSYDEENPYAKHSLKEDTETLAVKREAIKKPYAQAEELKTARARYKVVMNLLSADSDKTPAADTEQDPQFHRKVPAGTDPFFSALVETVNQAEGMPKKGTAELYKTWLNGQQGLKRSKKTGEMVQTGGKFKAEEREWMGLDEWLDEQGSTTRKELQDFVAENQLELIEDQKGESLLTVSGEANFKHSPHGPDAAENYLTDLGAEGYEDYNYRHEGDKVIFKNLPHHVYREFAKLAYKNAGAVSYTIDTVSIDMLPTGAGVVEGPDGFYVQDEEMDIVTDSYSTEEEAITQVLNDENILNTGFPTKYANWQLPGGDKYKELILRIPVQKETVTRTTQKGFVEVREHKIRDFDPVRGGYETGEVDYFLITAHGEWSEQGYPTREEAEKHLTKPEATTVDVEKDAYKGQHFDERNIIVHIRFNTRTGPNGETILFIEEIQSDWHQAGRKKGYKSQEIPDGMVYEANGKWRLRAVHDPSVAFSTRELANTYYRSINKRSGVPDAPFKKGWNMLAMKRMIRYAAENGYDTIAWTTGQQQAERYDLSKHVKWITAKPKYKPGSGPGRVQSNLPEGSALRLDKHREWELEIGLMKGGIENIYPTDETLEDHVGKELAEKILEAEAARRAKKKELSSKLTDMEQAGASFTRVNKVTDELAEQIDLGTNGHMFSGLDLKVGGEGMKGFYDNILVKETNKFVKKWGGRVGEIEIPKQPGRSERGDLETRFENWMDENQMLDHQGDHFSHPDDILTNESISITPAQEGFLRDMSTDMIELDERMEDEGVALDPHQVTVQLMGMNNWAVTDGEGYTYEGGFNTKDEAEAAMDKMLHGGTSKQHALTITEDMYDAAMASFPMFAKNGLDLGFGAKVKRLVVGLGRITPATKQLEQAMARFLGVKVKTGTYRQVAAPTEVSGAVKAVQRVYGKKVVFFKATGDEHLNYPFNGVALPSDPKTIYVNIDNQNPFLGVTGHELAHTLEQTHPELWDQIVNVAMRHVQLGGLKKFSDKMREDTEDTARQEADDETQMFREMVANVVGDAFMDPVFIRELAKKDRNLFQRILDAIIDILKSFQKKVKARGMGSGKYFTDLGTMISDVQEILGQYEESQAETPPAGQDPMFQSEFTKRRSGDLEKQMLDANYDLKVAGDKVAQIGERLRFAKMFMAAPKKEQISMNLKLRRRVKELEADWENGTTVEPLRQVKLMQEIIKDPAVDRLEAEMESARAVSEKARERLHRQIALRNKLASQEPAFNRKYTEEQKEFMKKAGMKVQRRSLIDTFRGYMDIQWRESKRNLSDAIQHGLFDKFYGIKRAYRDYLDETETPAMDGYIAARLSTGSASVMRGILLHGAPEWRGGVISKVPGSRGLLDVFEPVKQELDDFLGWMIARRAERLMEEEKERNFDDTDIAAGLELANGTLERNGVTVQRKDLYEKVAEDFAEFKGRILDLAERAGLIDEETRPVWDKADWIPFYRVDNARQRGGIKFGKGMGLSHQTSGIRRLVGGESALSDPLGNIVMNFNHLIEASMKNLAVLETVDALDGTGALDKEGIKFNPKLIPRGGIKKMMLQDGIPEEILDMMGQLGVFDGIAKLWAMAEPAGKEVVKVMRDGKPEYYRVNDPMLLKSLTNVNIESLRGLFLPMRAAKTLLTTMITSEPGFMARNFTRDTLHAWVINEDHFIPIVDSVHGLYKSAKEEGGMLDMMFAGGSFQGGYINGTDPDASRKSIRVALRLKGYDNEYIQEHLDTVIDLTAGVWDRWRRVGDAVENANREAVYEAATKNGKERRQAIFEAKDLMDFSMHGSWAWIQMFNDMLPFFNARLQGLYKLGRSGAVPVPGLIAKEIAMRGMWIALASTALAALNSGDEDYEALEEWDKDAYWHLMPGTKFHTRIPKPFEVGVLYGTIPERMYRAAIGKDTPEKLFERMGHALMDTMAANPIPQIMRPAMEVFANESMFTGRPIEGMADRNKMKRSRYNASTSETMVAMGPFLELMGLSPKQGEFLVRGYMGTLGSYSLMAADVITREIMGRAPVPAMTARQLPVLGGFYRGSGPAWNTRYGTEMYEIHREVTELYGTVKAYEKQGDRESIEGLMDEDNRKQLKARKRIGKWARDRSKMRKAIDRIYRDPKMDPKAKREKINKIIERRNAQDAKAYKYFSPMFGRK